MKSLDKPNKHQVTNLMNIEIKTDTPISHLLINAISGYLIAKTTFSWSFVLNLRRIY